MSQALRFWCSGGLQPPPATTMTNHPPPPSPEEDLSPGEAMLGGLLDASHTLPPDDIPLVAARFGAIIGAADIVMYLNDLSQRTLVPFGSPDRAPLGIDATLAGRVYRTSITALGEEGEVAGSRRVWVALLDGADRLGVIEAVLADPSERSVKRLEQLAGLLSEMIISKGQYGDAIHILRRMQPLSLAAEMRWTLAPPHTFTGQTVGVAGILEPAHSIAGDAFDYAIVGTDLHIAIFDAMGHGLVASRLANLALLSYRHSRRVGLGLMDTYAAMDEVVEDQFGGESFVTAQLAILGLETGRLRWINAGHPHPLLVRNATTIAIVPREVSIPIGLGGRKADVGELSLEPDDRLLFYSDGVIEARAPDGSQFGIERLSDFLARAVNASEPHPETVRRLAHAVLDHQSDRLDDDATVLLLHWAGRSGTIPPPGTA